MTYYYSKDGGFQPESNKEYKTEKGAVERMNKEGEGAVFDETGQLIISLVDEADVPEGALDTNTDGSVPVYNEDNEQIGTVDEETAAQAAGESSKESDESEQPEERSKELETTEQLERDSEEPGKTGELGGDQEDQAESEKLEDQEDPVEWEKPGEDQMEPELEQEADLKPSFRQQARTEILYRVQTTCDALRIRSGAGYGCRIVGYIRDKKPYGIVEENEGFGKLEDGSGWISLKHTARIS